MLKDLSSEQLLNLAFIGRCVKGLSHNINTPLAAVIGRAEMLQMRLKKALGTMQNDLDAESLEKCLRDASLIIDNSTRIAGIIKNAMQKSIHAENGSQQTLNLGAILNEELLFLAADMDFKHAFEKEFEISATVQPLEGVYCHFSNTFIELIHNAMHAMSEASSKKLFISLQNGNGCIDISIRDTGCGFDSALIGDIVHMLNSGGEKRDKAVPDGGLLRAAVLMKTYNPLWMIESEPGNTAVRIQLPT